MTITSSALDGIHHAQARLEQTASRLARLPDPTAQGGDVVSLSDEAVALLGADIEVAANVKAIHVANDIQRALLTLLD